MENNKDKSLEYNKLEEMRKKISELTNRQIEDCKIQVKSDNVFDSFLDMRKNLSGNDISYAYTKGYNLAEDLGGANYRILDRIDDLPINLQSMTMKLNNGQYALIDLPKELSFHNSKEVGDLTREIALSYANNENKMQYDKKFAHSWYYGKVSDGRGVCSDLASLVANGVDYDSSALCKNTPNNDKHPEWKYFSFDEILDARPSLDYKRANGYKTNLRSAFDANDMAMAATYFNLLFEIDENNTNLEPGDIIFFSNNKELVNGNFFLNITHVGAYIGNDQYVDWGDDGGHAIKLRYIDGFMPSVAMRIPHDVTKDPKKIQSTYFLKEDVNGHHKGQKFSGVLDSESFTYYVDGKEYSVSKDLITKDFVTQDKYPVVNVAVRSKASASSEKLGIIKRDSLVKGRPKLFWFEIDYQGERAFVPKDLLIFEKPKPKKKWYEWFYPNANKEG